MQKEIDRFALIVGAGKADPYVGKKLFTGRCANCHTLHAKGGDVGPDLTPFKRDDVAYLLLHIINPNAEIREGYETSVITTESGRTLSGIVIEKDARVVVLRSRRRPARRLADGRHRDDECIRNIAYAGRITGWLE